MISNKPIDLGEYVESGEKPIAADTPEVPGESGIKEGVQEETKVFPSEIELVEAKIKAPEKQLQLLNFLVLSLLVSLLRKNLLMKS